MGQMRETMDFWCGTDHAGDWKYREKDIVLHKIYPELKVTERIGEKRPRQSHTYKLKSLQDPDEFDKMLEHIHDHLNAWSTSKAITKEQEYIMVYIYYYGHGTRGNFLGSIYF
jgi:hypothetical protein